MNADQHAADGRPPGLDPEAVHAAARTLEESRFTASAGKGRVSATVTGSGSLVGVDIDPMLELHQRQRIAGWVLGAITDARAAAQTGAEEAFGSVVGDREAFLASARSAVPWLAPASAPSQERP